LAVKTVRFQWLLAPLSVTGKPCPSWRSLGTKLSTEQVSKTVRLSASESFEPKSPSTLHVQPLTHVRLWPNVGPSKSKGPTSTWNSNDASQLGEDAEALDKFKKVMFGAGVHQHKRYVPPAAVTGKSANETRVPLATAGSNCPTRGTRGTTALVPHVSSTMKRLPVARPSPVTPSKAHVRPLTHVRSCWRGEGPSKESCPISTTKSSALLQGHMPEHQHKR
jgi:hypothetical protein